MCAGSEKVAQSLERSEAWLDFGGPVRPPEGAGRIDERPLRVDYDERCLRLPAHGLLPGLRFPKCSTIVHTRNSAGITVAA